LETFGRPTGEHQTSHGIPPATPGINQHSPLGRLNHFHAKKKKQNQNNNNKKKNQTNKKLKTNTHQRRWVAVSSPGKGGGTRS
jgi:hypothetical protein